MNRLILLKDIFKTYKAGMVDMAALVSIKLQVDQGEFIANIGQSGTGKTTRLDIAGCLNHPTSREYELDGDQVTTLPIPG